MIYRGCLLQATDLLDLIRISTLDVVEAIAKWRAAQQPPVAPFMWNGANYLLKVNDSIAFCCCKLVKLSVADIGTTACIISTWRNTHLVDDLPHNACILQPVVGVRT
jgi:hypothetical protein